jgi:glycosyltransferase involved in cell wall biosynthesis
LVHRLRSTSLAEQHNVWIAIMSKLPLASIVISSFNYGRFLPDAIDSALGQTYPKTEVIVVDDGSADHSREVIAGYGKRVLPVWKDNGGQASALNAGYRASQGDVIFFVDSDDLLLPTAVEKVLPFFADPHVSKVHWPLWVVDDQGRRTGDVINPVLADGDLRGAVIRDGPYGYLWPDTTGNAWGRPFLEKVLPVPEEEFRTCPDLYLCGLAPFFGTIGKIAEPQSCWRAHAQNHSLRDSFEERLHAGLRREEYCFDALSRYCETGGITPDAARWRTNGWWHQIDAALRGITALVPPGDAFILVDQDAWGSAPVIGGRRRIPFLEREGGDWGEPGDDATAIRELERLRESGANFMVFVQPALWWLEYYAGLHRHLLSNFRCTLANDTLVVFDLRAAPGSTAAARAGGRLVRAQAIATGASGDTRTSAPGERPERHRWEPLPTHQ